MNKVLTYLFLMIATAGFLQLEAYEGSFEIRSSAFYHSSERLREIYGDFGPTFGLEATKKLNSNYEAWIDFDASYVDSSSGCCCKTNMSLLNASFGINYVFHFNSRFESYIGIGPSFTNFVPEGSNSLELQQAAS